MIINMLYNNSRKIIKLIFSIFSQTEPHWLLSDSTIHNAPTIRGTRKSSVSFLITQSNVPLLNCINASVNQVRMFKTGSITRNPFGVKTSWL